MKNRVVSILLALVMVFSLTAVASAEGDLTVKTGENVKLYVNEILVEGSVAISAEDELMFADDEALVIKTDYGYYLPNEVFTLSESADFTSAVAVCSTGLTLQNGAQVRVGGTELEEGAQLNAQADSGLRFIAAANYADTLIADENVAFGIKITAEGSDNQAYIQAEKFQNDDESVFSAAITNLSTANYNRNYTATTYALVTLANGDEVEFNNGEVTRSIYQVSVGLMKNSEPEENTTLPYTISDAVKNVLNAYINQTGIRLTYKNDGSMGASNAYNGDLFFDVTYSLNEDGSTNVTVTPLGADDAFANEVAIADWWKDYIRVNNANTAVMDYIKDAKVENNVLTFKFDIGKETVEYTFNQEDNVMVVSTIGDDYIEGYKAGVLTRYNFASSVEVVGLSNSIADVVPGSVVLVGTTTAGECGGIELLASLGLPINGELFESKFGVYAASDGSTMYTNVVTEMYSKSSTKITCLNADETKTVYSFLTKCMCYRVGIATEGDTTTVTVTGAKVTTSPSIFGKTSDYHNYMYLRYNTETSKVVECVYYCVPKDLDFSGDDEYSGIFSID